jgi:hypothetical protein
MAIRKSTTTSTSSVSSASVAAIQKLFAEARAIYAPGGALQTGMEAGISRGRTKAVAGGMQHLASMGLAGTSMAGGLAKKFEEEVAMPTRAKAESSRLSALSGLMQSQASAMASMATRTSRQTTTSPYSAPSMSGYGAPPPPRISPTPSRSTVQPAARTSTAQPRSLPSTSYKPKQPSVASTGGVFFGKAFYDKQKSSGSFYSDFQSSAPKTTSPIMSEYNKYR